MSVRILLGDCRERLRALPDGVAQTCVTSPPYFGLRDYGVDGQIGLEATPDEFVAGLVEVFREVRRVLREDGTLWLNLGDSYAGSWGAQSRGEDVGPSSGLSGGQVYAAPKGTHTGSVKRTPGLKPKDLMGIPWRVAFALQADGWYLRQDIIWAKPNPMPESVRDRCTKAHEYVFLLSKGPRYYFDAEEIAEPAIGQTVHDLTGGGHDAPGQTAHTGSRTGRGGRTKAGLVAYSAKVSADRKALRSDIESRHRSSIPGGQSMQAEPNGTRNKRSVWTVATQPFKEAHFATYPPELIEPCILAGSPRGGLVLDPFGGAGTTGLVADRLGRDALLIELNPEYAEIARKRLTGDAGMFAQVEVAA